MGRGNGVRTGQTQERKKERKKDIGGDKIRKICASALGGWASSQLGLAPCLLVRSLNWKILPPTNCEIFRPRDLGSVNAIWARLAGFLSSRFATKNAFPFDNQGGA